MPQEKMLDTVMRKLDETRGTWPEISVSSGVPYQTLTKIACGIVRDPRISTVQALLDYFSTRSEQAAATDNAGPTH